MPSLLYREPASVMRSYDGCGVLINNKRCALCYRICHTFRSSKCASL